MKFSAGLLALISVPLCLAQSFTECDPLKASCAPDAGLATSSFFTDFSKSHDGWVAEQWNSNPIDYSGGAQFKITKPNDVVNLLSDWYIFYGEVEVKMKAAPGRGIISSVVLQSDDRDEIDWEWIGSDSAQVQSNYYGKGDDSDWTRGGFHAVASPQTTSHTYGIQWTPSQVIWSIDGTPVRTLNKADAQGGSRFPQTPMRMRLGIWPAGDSDREGTVTWAGGKVQYEQAPFIMNIETISIKNYNPANQYVWTDQSGSCESIKLVGAPNGATKADCSGATAPSPAPAPAPAPARPAAAHAPPASFNKAAAPPAQGPSFAPVPTTVAKILFASSVVSSYSSHSSLATMAASPSVSAHPSSMYEMSSSKASTSESAPPTAAAASMSMTAGAALLRPLSSAGLGVFGLLGFLVV